MQWHWRGLWQFNEPWVIWQKNGPPDAEVTCLVSLSLSHRLPLFCSLLLLILTLTIPSRVWLAGLTVLAGAHTVAYFWASQLANHLTIDRRLRYAWMQVGDVLEEVFVLSNETFLPAPWVELLDLSNLPGYSASTVRGIGSYGRVKWRVNGTCRQRGQFHLGPWELHLTDPFGFFHVRQRYQTRRDVLVYPPITDLPQLNLPQGPFGAGGQARTPRRSWEPLASRGSLRDYVQGDPLHLIHWPSTARHDTFLVKEFEPETTGHVWLVLDFEKAVQVGRGPESTQEYGIILTASLAARLLEQGLPVGLWSLGENQRCFLPPAPGKAHLWQLLRALAPLEPGIRPLGTILEEAAYLLPRGDTALIVTPSTRADWTRPLFRLRQRGVGVTAWLLDAASFTQPEEAPPDSPAAMDALRGLLAAQGISSQVIRRGDLKAAEPLEPGGGSWKFKVLPTGQVVVVSRPTPIREAG